MGKSAKRSLFGYDPVSVNNKIEMLTEMFETEKAEVEKELAAAIKEVEELQLQINTTRNAIDEQKSLEDEIADILISTHMKAVQKVYEMVEKVQKEEKERQELFGMQQQKRQAVKNTLEKLIEEMQYLNES